MKPNTISFSRADHLQVDEHLIASVMQEDPVYDPVPEQDAESDSDDNEVEESKWEKAAKQKVRNKEFEYFRMRTHDELEHMLGA